MVDRYAPETSIGIVVQMGVRFHLMEPLKSMLLPVLSVAGVAPVLDEGQSQSHPGAGGKLLMPWAEKARLILSVHLQLGGVTHQFPMSHSRLEVMSQILGKNEQVPDDLGMGAAMARRQEKKEESRAKKAGSGHFKAILLSKSCS